MEETTKNDQSDKPKSDTSKGQAEKPAAGSASPSRATTQPEPTGTKPVTKASTTSKTSAAPKTTGQKTSTTGVTRRTTPAGQVKPPVKKTQGRSAPGSPAKPSAKGPEDIIPPSQEGAPGSATRIAERKSKKQEKASKMLKIQKIELASLEKERDRFMKNLISAIEKKKKRKKIRSLARDFNRIEKRVKKKTASYVKAKKKLAN